MIPSVGRDATPTTPAVGGLAATLVLALGVWSARLGTDATDRVSAQTCARPVAIDGRLRCDDEAPATIGALCGTDAPRAIRAGDRIDVAAVCAGDVDGHARMAAADLRRLAVAIDINRADLDELRSLPGIGPVLAERIVAGRPFAGADDLLRVRGIGPKTVARLRPRLSFD